MTEPLDPPASAPAPTGSAASEPPASQRSEPPLPAPAPLPIIGGASGPVSEGLPRNSLGVPLPVSLGVRPSFVFFGVVSAVSLLADVLSKAWAQIILSARTQSDPSIVLIKNHLSLTLALNRGGAWGLMSDAKEAVRHPFFFLVSALAIAFIISLYGRLAPGQRALKWGLPLVFGGALGNFSDRLVRSGVIDFIDYRADWIQGMNGLIAKLYPGWAVTDHWPTFNVADIAICVGVGLMAVDMFTSKRGAAKPAIPTASVAPHA